LQQKTADSVAQNQIQVCGVTVCRLWQWTVLAFSLVNQAVGSVPAVDRCKHIGWLYMHKRLHI